MPAPVLDVEVVSPEKENSDRDYRYIRAEYAARGINEYSIIVPKLNQITICLWGNGQYEYTIYNNDSILASTIMPRFSL